jgi:hypothetical protein
MSDGQEPPGSDVVPFHPVAQLTRALVQKNRVVFEVQVPDEASAPAYAEALKGSFRSAFVITKGGIDQNYPCPVEVAVDGADKAKVVATYSSDTRPARLIASDYFRAVDSFRELRISTDAIPNGRVRMNGRIVDAIKSAFNILQRANAQEHGAAVAAQLARRSSPKEPDGRGSR